MELEGLPFVFEIELHICVFHSLVSIRRYHYSRTTFIKSLVLFGYSLLI